MGKDVLKRYIIGCLALIAFFFNVSVTQAISLTDDWKYTEVDIRDVSNISLTSLQINELDDVNRWYLLRPGENPHLSNKARCVYIATRMPRLTIYNNPVLFFVTENESVNVFLDKELIYTNGEKGHEKNKYGAQWHMVTLPSNYLGRQVIFQLSSDNPRFVGQIDDVKIDEGYRHTQYIFQHDGLTLVSVPLAIVFIIMLMLYYWIYRSSEYKFVYILMAVYFLIFTVFLISRMWTLLFIYDNPAFWHYIFMLSAYTMVLPLEVIAYNILSGTYKNHILVLIFLHSLFLFGSIMGEMAGYPAFNSGLMYYFILINIAMLIISFYLYRAGKSSNSRVTALSWAYLVTTLVYIADGLASHFEVFSTSFLLEQIYILPMAIFVVWLMKNTMTEEKRLTAVNELLKHEVKAERLKASIDPLTKCFSRNVLDNVFKEAISEAEQAGISFAVIMFDVDKFKEVNDTFGHDAGDNVLVGFASIVRRNLDARHTFIRYGGEEFLMICSGYTLEDAWLLAERIREELYAVPLLDNRAVTCSAGVSQWHIGASDSKEQIIKRADKALYYAKEHGRNKCIKEDEIIV